MSLSDKVLLLVGYLLLALFVIAIIIPIIYIVIASFMDPITLQNSGISFDLDKWTTPDLGRFPQRNYLFRCIYGCFRRCNAARSVSDVQSGL